MEKNNSGIGFRHYRQVTTVGDKGVINSRGGATMAFAEVPTEEGPMMFAAGVAYCNPKDNFQYVYGRNKSRGRLVQAGSTNYSEVDNDKTFYLEVEDRDSFFTKMDTFMADCGLTHL